MTRPIKNKNIYKSFEDYSTLTITRVNGDSFTFIIDTEDTKRLKTVQWCMTCLSKKRLRNIYAMGNIDGRNIYLHHFLIGNPPKGLVVDHQNRNTLDNRKKNICFVKNSQNTRNRIITNKHGFPGLYRIKNLKKKTSRKWQVRIRIRDLNSTTKNTGGNCGTRLVHVGVFYTIKEAIAARRRAELNYFGRVFH